ncbi:MAG: hypothetical protein M0Z60_15330 [Nitrospiraceae bacterium]|nr:hypothetical protein [Nitrospiraceae bacterium]
MISSLVLVVIFMVVPSAGFLLIILAEGVFPGAAQGAAGPVELVEIFSLHLSLSLVYISSYPAVRAVSPSLEIMLYIGSSPERKLTEREIAKKFTDTTLVNARVDDLMIYRLLTVRGGRYALTHFGRFIIRGFVFYRKMLGLPEGEG